MKVDLGPVTRLEGHLSVHTNVKNNIISDAECRGEMYRGFETILVGRDPLDAQQITQRICGVCPYAHGIASSYAQENAYNMQVTKNGRILHNLIQGANHLYDYLLHFYQLAALDFVDITAILKYNGKNADLNNIKDWVNLQLKSNTSYAGAPFLPRLSGSYIPDTDVNIGAIQHYVESLKIQQKANQACAIFGGRFPHSTAVFPSGSSQDVSTDRIIKYQSLIREVRDFIHRKYIPDIAAVAKTFPTYWNIGKSKGGFLSFGLMPLSPDQDGIRLFGSGVYDDGKMADVNYQMITEDVAYSKYSSPNGLSVAAGQQQPDPHKINAYTWTKAPRYNDRMMEVGPAARVMVDYYQNNNKTVKSLVNKYKTLLNITTSKLNSVLGRHLCRGISAAVIADYLLETSDQLDVGKPGISKISIPESGEGYGATEASRGALLHYIKIKNYKIEKYQCVVPTTWNISPKDSNNKHGAVESALIGTKVLKADEQIEAGRIIRSFDPCLACSIH